MQRIAGEFVDAVAYSRYFIDKTLSLRCSYRVTVVCDKHSAVLGEKWIGANRVSNSRGFLMWLGLAELVGSVVFLLH